MKELLDSSRGLIEVDETDIRAVQGQRLEGNKLYRTLNIHLGWPDISKDAAEITMTEKELRHLKADIDYILNNLYGEVEETTGKKGR